MENKDKYLKAADGAVIYMICLLIFGIGATLLCKVIGIWAIILCEVLAILCVIGAARITHLKTKAYFKFTKPTAKQTCGCALIFSTAILITFPLILFGQLIVPSFAQTGFQLSDIYGGSNIFLLIIAVLIAGISHTMLFDGYLYSRFRVFDAAISAVLISALFGIYNLSLYIVIPMALFQAASLYIRRHTGSMSLCYVIHVFACAVAIALTKSSSITSELMGESMGWLGVCGLTCIFIAAAIPAYMGGRALLNEGRKSNVIKNAVLIGTAIVFFAIGCGISSF